MSHLEKNGFKVEKKIVFGKGFTDLKRKHGVPEKLFACHTALIEGYIVEGHVPADLIYKLLKENRRCSDSRSRACPSVHRAWKAANLSPMKF